MIERLLAIPYDTIDKFAAINEDSPVHSEYFHNWGGFICCREPQCDAVIYGSLLLSLQRKSLWPRRQTQGILKSSIEFGADISELNVSVLAESNHHDSDRHKNCRRLFDYETKVAKILEEVESPVGEFHLQHLAAQK